MGLQPIQRVFFHLVTHACFKALLFLGAGSVIMATHHEHDIRKMGNLRKYLPMTFATYFIGTIALVALPPTAGFFSKDAIIEAVELTNVPWTPYCLCYVTDGGICDGIVQFSLTLSYLLWQRKHVRESA